MILMIFFFAMALAEIGIARDVVIIGFALTVITLFLAVLIVLWQSGPDGASRILGPRESAKRDAGAAHEQ